jgi:hypothetical protein
MTERNEPTLKITWVICGRPMTFVRISRCDPRAHHRASASCQRLIQGRDKMTTNPTGLTVAENISRSLHPFLTVGGHDVPSYLAINLRRCEFAQLQAL